MSDLTHYSICKTLVSCYFVFLIPGLQHQSKMMFATHASLAFARADVLVFILLTSWFFCSSAGGLFSGLLRVWGKPRFVLTAQERDEFMTAHGIFTSAILHFSICCCLCSFFLATYNVVIYVCAHIPGLCCIDLSEFGESQTVPPTALPTDPFGLSSFTPFPAWPWSTWITWHQSVLFILVLWLYFKTFVLASRWLENYTKVTLERRCSLKIWVIYLCYLST